jgi:hypothetical protein
MGRERHDGESGKGKAIVEAMAVENMNFHLLIPPTYPLVIVRIVGCTLYASSSTPPLRTVYPN